MPVPDVVTSVLGSTAASSRWTASVGDIGVVAGFSPALIVACRACCFSLDHSHSWSPLRIAAVSVEPSTRATRAWSGPASQTRIV